MNSRCVLVAAGVALAMDVLTAGLALADGGPHGGYDKLSDGTSGVTEACAGCHRTHTATSQARLLRNRTTFQLCISCHDGSGSRLDVQDGVKLSAFRGSGGVTQTVLLGGGFSYVNGVAVTSRHDVNSAANAPWGFRTNVGVTTTVGSANLDCTSCHNPHGSLNYRILKEKVGNGAYTNTVSVLAYYNGAFTKDEGAPGFNPGAPADKYAKNYYGSAGLTTSGGYDPGNNLTTSAGNSAVNGTALLCGACHSSYPSSSGKTLPSDFGGTITGYRHRTEVPFDAWTKSGAATTNPETAPYNPGSGPLPALRLASGGGSGEGDNKIVTCLTCHNAHGTAAKMQKWSVARGINDDDGNPGVSPNPISGVQSSGSRSMLLVQDNRGVCEACHQW